MVIGPILDALAARKTGTTAVHVLNKGNRLLISNLSLRIRIAFWLTNVPYWLLAGRLLHTPCAMALPAAHALAGLVIASVSTAFHGVVLFGGGASSYERVTQRLLMLDISAANGYGITLSLYAGLSHAAVVFALPLLLLTASAVLKRRGRAASYAALHGSWHVLSATALWHLLYREPAS